LHIGRVKTLDMSESLQINTMSIDEEGIVEIVDCGLESVACRLTTFVPFYECGDHLSYKVNHDTGNMAYQQFHQLSIRSGLKSLGKSSRLNELPWRS
jgi:hypothetical protein